MAELKRLKELEAENAKLKRMYAELALENTAINFLAENSDAVGRLRKRCPRPGGSGAFTSGGSE